MFADSGSEARSSVSPDRVKELSGEIKKMIDGEEVSLTQLKKFGRNLNLAQTPVIGVVGMVALRPLSDVGVRGGTKSDMGAIWALERLIKLCLVSASRVIKPADCASAVGSYSDAVGDGGSSAGPGWADGRKGNDSLCGRRC